MRNAKQIAATIKTLGKNTASLRAKYQAVLIEVAAHTYEHGDPRMFDAILEAASGLNRKQMVKWIEAYGFANVTKEGVKLAKKKRDEADFADGDAVIEYLTNEAPDWWAREESIEQIVKDLDVSQLIQIALKKMDKQVEDEGVITNKDPELTMSLMRQFEERVATVH